MISSVAYPIKKYTFELIFVNDGSSDASIDLLQDIAKKDSRITVIDFSRNFV